MICYVMTHGDREEGPDPTHTAEGYEQIARLPLPGNISTVVVGTGQRFEEMLETIKLRISAKPRVFYSPFVGGPESWTDRGAIILSHGKRVDYRTEYKGISNAPNDCFNAWAFVLAFPPRTLFLTGRAFLQALGFREGKQARLYELDAESRRLKDVSEVEVTVADA